MDDTKLINLGSQHKAECLAGKLTIHRYLPVRFVFDIFRQNAMRFSKMPSWHDPFEGYLIDLYCERNKKYKANDIKNMFAFSCWTFSSESDHLWKIYTPNCDGVRISVNLREILHFSPYLSVGIIEYLKLRSIESLINKFYAKEFKRNKLFFLKRIAFAAEQEIRLRQQLDQNSCKEDHFYLPFDIKLIKLFFFDPRMDNDVYESIKYRMINHYHIDKHIIKPSLLYNPRKAICQNPDF